MLNLGGLAFAQPWLLLALAALPVLWLLLRVIPPAPRRLDFPAIRLLTGLAAAEETPAKTPLWLVILRLLIAALIIFGLAQPLLNPDHQLSGSGPVILVVDNGWSAARNWPQRQAEAERLLAQAERDGRAAAIFATADPPVLPDAGPGLYPAGEARQLIQQMRPRPWPADRQAVLAPIQALTVQGSAQVVWLSDGMSGRESDQDLQNFATELRHLGRLDVLAESPLEQARLLLPPESEGLSPAADRSARACRTGRDGHHHQPWRRRQGAGQYDSDLP